MSPGAIGTVFAMVSAINVVGSQLSARVSDRWGRRAVIVPGLALIAVSVAGLPMASDSTELTALMALWATGGAVVSTGPTAYLADLVEESDRGQALAMLRTCGDLGLLLGAGTMGLLADFTSMPAAFAANSALLALATVNMGFRSTETWSLGQRTRGREDEDKDIK